MMSDDDDFDLTLFLPYLLNQAAEASSMQFQQFYKDRFVSRARDDEDRRVERLSLTAQGRAAYRDLYAVAQRYDAELTAGMTQGERHALRQLLVKLQDRGSTSGDRNSGKTAGRT